MTIIKRSLAELRAPANALTDAERARLDAMSEDEIEANALADPDNPPWTDEELSEARASRSLRKSSLTWDEVRRIKAVVTHHAPYSDRISFGFALRLVLLEETLGETHAVLAELNAIEGLAIAPATHRASQFKHPPLHPLWHKHFSTSRHLVGNIGRRWAIHDQKAKTHRDLDAMIAAVAKDFGHDPDLWPKKLAYDFVMGAIEGRAARNGLTGDWIIFAEHEGQKYYLDIAEHDEAKQPERLIDKIRRSSKAEFGFLFN